MLNCVDAQEPKLAMGIRQTAQPLDIVAPMAMAIASRVNREVAVQLPAVLRLISAAPVWFAVEPPILDTAASRELRGRQA